MKIKLNDIVFREDLYPRFEPNHAIIQKYSESIEHLPPIKLDQHNILIDGFHRWKAYQLAGEIEISYEVINVESEKELKKLAYQYNSNHGIQLSNDEKRKYAIEMIEEMSVADLSTLLSVSRQIIEKWTKNKREELEKERNRKIIEMYLRAWNTQETIAKEFGLTQPAIVKIIENFITNAKNGESYKDFKPLIYNIWNTPKGNETSHFGSFPKIFMDNLLYYHTEPLDIVFDPFSGNGTTIDSCKDFFRRYYCSDRIVKAGREKDIIEHDIKLGLPDDLPKPKMVFLDPPYWLQAEGKYSNDADDLGNMDLNAFNESMSCLFDELIKRKIELIAIVIQPTQYKNNWTWTDHIIHFDRMLNKKYDIEMRYILPYSSEQYLPQMVIKAKEERKCLSTFRDLVIWKIK